MSCLYTVVLQLFVRLRCALLFNLVVEYGVVRVSIEQTKAKFTVHGVF
jgi:hypothetical protein